MSIAVALVFHFNQHLSEQALTASRACYRGLLRVLRRHPSLKVNLHVSGTLLHALQWLDPEPLQLIRNGLAAGQFELLGSTYAQNVAYATDDWDNARQIELHRQTLKQTFGVEPTAFWNPERCWRQSLLPLIADAGYRLTLVEDHILRASGATGPQVFATRHAGRQLIAVCDDETFKHKFNFAAWFGRPRQALDHLRELAERPGSESFLVAYAEDAEAMGLWGYPLGLIPHQSWANLDALLTQFEALPWLRLTHLSDAPAPTAELTPIVDGSAAWMDNSLRVAGAPYHEDGYRDWFDFVKRSPKVARFSRVYGQARASIRSLQPSDGSPAVEALYRLAVHALCSNQYEFACIGVGGEGFPGWEGARAAFVIVRAAELMGRPRSGAWLEDVDRDGRREVLLCDGRQLAVLSRAEARLLYWFDLRAGAQRVGNQLAVPVDEGDGQRPASWLPASFEPDMSLFDEFHIEEAAPTRMARFLPDWVWRGEPATVPLYARDMQLSETRAVRPVRRCALEDALTVDAQPPLARYSGRAGIEDHGAVVTRDIGSELTFVKRVSLENGAVRADYLIENQGARQRTVTLRIANELSPGYAAVPGGGRAALAFVDDEQRPGVVNVHTGQSVIVEAVPHPGRSVRAEGLLALHLTLVYEMSVPPQRARTVQLRLVRREA